MNHIYFFLKKLLLHKRFFIAGLALSIVLAFSSIALLTLSGWFITAAAFAGITAITASNFNYFIPAALIRFLALTRIISRYFDRVINHDYTFKILKSLRVWFYETLIPLSPAHLLSEKSGDLLNRMVNDIDTLDQLYLNVLSPILISLFILMASTAFVFYFTKRCALILFFMLCVGLFILPIMIYKKSLTIGKNLQNAISQLRIKTIDMLQGFTDLLLFVEKENRLDKITLAQNNLQFAQKQFSFMKSATIGVMQLLSGLTIFLILYFGIPLVYSNAITAITLAMIIFLIIVVFEQCAALPFAFLSLGKTTQAAHRLLFITEQNPAVTFQEKNSKSLENYSAIFDSVSFSYKNSTSSCIKNFSLIVPEKTIIGITGDSGSGKTTLLNLLARIWDVNAGKIMIDNHDIKSFSEKDLRKTISYVTQHVHIFNASIRDNLTLMQKNISDEMLFDVLEKMDLADHVNNLPEKLNTEMGEFGKNFSGGQIRRIAIARALLSNTPILLLDEPSTGLDAILLEMIWKNCEMDFQNKTVIVATHNQKLLNTMNHTITLTPT